jgi:hypothetical protein
MRRHHRGELDVGRAGRSSIRRRFSGSWSFVRKLNDAERQLGRFQDQRYRKQAVIGLAAKWAWREIATARGGFWQACWYPANRFSLNARAGVGYNPAGAEKAGSCSSRPSSN